MLSDPNLIMYNKQFRRYKMSHLWKYVSMIICFSNLLYNKKCWGKIWHSEYFQTGQPSVFKWEKYA